MVVVVVVAVAVAVAAAAVGVVVVVCVAAAAVVCGLGCLVCGSWFVVNGLGLYGPILAMLAHLPAYVGPC